ncbi:YcxB family protein [Clostridium perfringens]|nr:YcxB family protein [Clostridium perfringens]MDM0937065.1 YcxB family protein [Clostridium perfringens]
MTINYKNTFDDLIALSTYIFENDRIIQRKIKILQVLFPIYIMLSYLSFAGIYKADMTLFIFFLTLSVFLVISVPFILKFVHKRQFLRNFNSVFSNGEVKDNILTLDEKGIVNEDENILLKLKWNGVQKVSIIDNYIFIFIDELRAIVLPNDAFKSEEQKKKFLDIIYRYINKEKIKIDI